MKKILFTLILFIAAIPCMNAAGNDSSISIYCTEETDDASDEESDDDWYIEPDPSRKKTPAAPVIVNISVNEGISIPGLDSSEIYSYEIRDAYGNTTAVLSDEDSFIETLFSLRGEYRLIFRLPGKSLVGWIYL